MTALPVTRLSRDFSAPPATLFRAWSSADHISRWFGPSGFTIPHAEVEMTVGGVFDVCMRGPTGDDHWIRGRIAELREPEWLVIEMNVPSADGTLLFTAHTEIAFAAILHGGTRLTVTQSYRLFDPQAMPMLDGAAPGWSQTLDGLAAEIRRMAGAVHGMFRVERHFAAPLPLLWRALSDGTTKAGWFAGPPDHCQEVERLADIRVGGREFLKGRWTGGMTTCFDAVYHDVVPECRLVYSYAMFIDDRKISVSLATMECAASESGSRLAVTEQGVFLDGYDDGGSREQGTAGLLDALAAFLKTQYS